MLHNVEWDGISQLETWMYVERCKRNFSKNQRWHSTKQTDETLGNQQSSSDRVTFQLQVTFISRIEILIPQIYDIFTTMRLNVRLWHRAVLYSYRLVTLAARKAKRCSEAREAVRLLWWRSELLPERKTFPTETTQLTIHLTTLQNATFQTGSTHADVSW
jgi:hypothetical protein